MIDLKYHLKYCKFLCLKKYVVDIFEDGSEELTAMLKVTWDAVYVLMTAPLKKREYVYTFDKDTSCKMTAKECSFELALIFF